MSGPRRRSAMIAGDPWTLLITLEEEPDSLGCVVLFQELTIDGQTVDHWERHFDRVDEALRAIESAYGVGPDDWVLG
jgi:hypothetical protein